MKRKPKRYSSHDAIVSAIDYEIEAIATAMKLAEKYDAEASVLKEWFGTHQLDPKASENSRVEWHGRNERLKIILNESGILHRSIPRHSLMLRRLKATLASFDTIPMTGLLPDASVLLASPSEAGV